MTMRKIPFRYVEVLWEDAASHNESWVDPKTEDVSTILVATRGWLVKETERYISVASSVSAEDENDETVGNVMSVPRGMIKTIRDLRVTTAKKKPDAPAT